MSEFFNVWEYYFSKEYRIDDDGKRTYWNRGDIILSAFLFYLILPIFIMSSPYIYFKFRKILRKENKN